MYTEIEIVPRFCETDARGHINNTTSAVWLEDGRARLNRALGDSGTKVAIVHVSINYRREMFYGTNAFVRTGVEKVGQRPVTWRQEIWQEGQLCVDAKAVCSGFDPAAKISLPLSQRYIDALSPYMWKTDVSPHPARTAMAKESRELP